MKFGIGQPVRRTEDPVLLTGRGQYTADVNWANQCFGVAVRSPHAHARILEIDTTDALAMPGVLDIFTGADMIADGLGPMPNNLVITQTNGEKMREPPAYGLTADKVRHVGDPVAFVVAESLDQARDAAEAVMVTYEDLPCVVDTDLADAPDAPLLYDDIPENRAFQWDFGNAQGTSDALTKADRVIELKLINNRVIANPMEPRAAIGIFEGDDQTGHYTLHTPTQGVHSLRNRICEGVLKIDPNRLRVITGNVGGGFGMKIFIYPEQICVLYAAKRIRRPVKWVGERTYDSFTTDKHGRDHVVTVKLGVDEKCRILGLDVRIKAAMGAYMSGFQAFIPTTAGAKMYSGVYAIPNIHLQVHGLFTNTTPVDAYRGAGRPEAAYLLERLMDKAAYDLDMDPMAFRLINYIAPEAMPFETSVGPIYDSGDFPRLHHLAMQKADIDGFAARKARSEKAGMLRGIGMAFYIECCGAGPGETADLRVAEDGHVTLMIGTQDNGQGHQTAYQQILSGKLGIPMQQITVIQGDTQTVKHGAGTGGSRSIPEGGVGVDKAAHGVLERAKTIASIMLEAAAADLEYAHGAFSVAGTDRSVAFNAVAKAAHDPMHVPDGQDPGLDFSVKHRATAQTYPNGVHVCELEIDPETGVVDIQRYTVVDDFGTVVNPLMLEGQVHGGIGQGLGQALMEDTRYDPESGQLITGSFMDYEMPRADRVPSIDFTAVEDIPCTTNPLGIKGAGEAGAIGAPPASINAIIDALKGYGVAHMDMPATQHKIWETIQRSRQAEAAE